MIMQWMVSHIQGLSNCQIGLEALGHCHCPQYTFDWV